MFDRQQHFCGTAEALSELILAWRTDSPAMSLLALLPEAEAGRLPDLQAACRQHDVPLLGAIFPALIVDDTFVSQGMQLLRLPDSPPHFLLDGMDSAPEAAGQRLASAIRATGHLERPDSKAFLVFDSMLPAIGSTLISAHGLLDYELRCAGVNAGSESFQPMPCLFDRERLIGYGVLGLLLGGGTRVGVEHDYPVSQTLMRASSTVGNRIDRIDGKPAMAVYQSVIKDEFGIDLTKANFYDYAVHYPFGVITALDVLVRIPVAFGDDGAIICVGEVPPNSALRLLRAPPLEESRCVTLLARELAPGQRAAAKPGALLTFYCAGRRMHFGDDAQRELSELHAATGTESLIGALTLGEIDSSQEMNFPRFHNASVVCLR